MAIESVGHRSYSSFSSWMRCGKSWQLERELNLPQEPAFWFVGGSAFHSAAEKYLLYFIESKQND